MSGWVVVLDREGWETEPEPEVGIRDDTSIAGMPIEFGVPLPVSPTNPLVRYYYSVSRIRETRRMWC